MWVKFAHEVNTVSVKGIDGTWEYVQGHIYGAGSIVW